MIYKRGTARSLRMLRQDTRQPLQSPYLHATIDLDWGLVEGNRGHIPEHVMIYARNTGTMV